VTAFVNKRMGNGDKGACFVCNKKGHRYMQCYKATTQQRQQLTDELETRRASRIQKWQEKNDNS
jgi:molybdenum-dependent DNA-binding transcriptional regulator ModE